MAKFGKPALPLPKSFFFFGTGKEKLHYSVGNITYRTLALHGTAQESWKITKRTSE
jgi:hypothetical protein